MKDANQIYKQYLSYNFSLLEKKHHIFLLHAHTKISLCERYIQEIFVNFNTRSKTHLPIQKKNIKTKALLFQKSKKIKSVITSTLSA